MNQKEEKLLREFVRRKWVKPLIEQKQKIENNRSPVLSIKTRNNENYITLIIADFEFSFIQKFSAKELYH